MHPFSVFKLSSSIGSNVYFVNTSPPVIIDSGHPHFANETVFLMSSLLPLEKTAYILSTHSHPDHLGAASLFQNISKASHCIFHPSKNEKLTPLHKEQIRLNIEEPQYDRILDDGEKIILDDDIIQVIHTPGHADDHCCFYFEKRRFLFTGDLLANNDTGFLNLNKPYKTALQELMSSIAKCQKLTTHRVFSGHGEAYRTAPWDRQIRKLQLLERNPQHIIPHTLISPFLFFLWAKGDTTRDVCEKYILEHGYLFNDFLENVTSDLLLKEFRKLVCMLELTGVISSNGSMLCHHFTQDLHSMWFR